MGAPPQILLGNLGMADSLILMVLALVVFGPRRLPQIGRQIGKLMYEFRKASNDFKFQMEEELRLAEDADRRKKEEAERARNLALNPPPQSVEARADIGAVEQASVSAQPPSPTPPDGTPSPEEGSAAEEHTIRYPRINPPSTGEPIAAARPNAAPANPMEDAVAMSGNSEVGVADDPAQTAPESSPETASEPAQSEAVSRHG